MTTAPLVVTLAILAALLAAFVGDYGRYVGHRDFASSLAASETDRLLSDCLDGDPATDCTTAAWAAPQTPSSCAAVCVTACYHPTPVDVVRVDVEIVWEPAVMKGWGSTAAFRLTEVGVADNAGVLFAGLATCP